MDKLAPDVIAEILSYCNKQDAVELSRVNKSLYASLDEHSPVWRVLCNRDGYNTDLVEPITTYRDLYMQFENSVGVNDTRLFCYYDALKMEWELNEDCLRIIDSIINKTISIVTVVDLAKNETSNHVLNTLLGIQGYKNATVQENEPTLYMWGKPLIYSSNRNVLFLHAHGLIANEEDDDHVRYLRKYLMDFIMMISSTVIVCKEKDTPLSVLDSLVNVVADPPSIFSTWRDTPSCLIVHHDDDKYAPRAHHIWEQATVETEDDKWYNAGPFSSCLVNWFGKVHGMSVNPSQQVDDAYRSNVWTFLNSVLLELGFGWPLSRWDRLRPTGPLCRSYFDFLINGENKFRSGAFVLTANIGHTPRTSITQYDKTMFKFARQMLAMEMESSIEFYRRATESELSAAHPLEMQDLVQISEMHATSALRTFTQSIKPALFNHHIVDELETQLKSGINNCFRPLWRENARHSENYSQSIFDSCFKWIRAQGDCHNDDDVQFKQGFVKRFQESLEIYLNNARGTRTHFVMNFCSKQYIQMVAEMYPDMTDTCDALQNEVEQATMQQTMEIDRQRSFLQRITGIRLKLLTIENATERLREEIWVRTQQMQPCEEWNNVVRDRFHIVTGRDIDVKRYDQARRVFIESAQQQLEHELEQYEHFKQELKGMTKKTYSPHVPFETIM